MRPWQKSAMTWGLRIVVGLGCMYVVLSAALVAAMLQPPLRFGHLMRYAPMPLVWGVLPGRSIWLWARDGSVVKNDIAPDFDLPTGDRTSRVRLSSHRGQKPVVLVFGSYT